MRVRSYDAERTIAVPQTASAQTGLVKAGSAEVRTDAGTDGSVVTTSDAEARTTTSSSGLSAREQRYNELLRAAPPAPARSEDGAAAEPSLLQRVVAPIANALGMGKQPATPAPGPKSQTQARAEMQRAAQQEQEQAREGRPGETPEDEQPGEDDRDADVKPPVLQHAEFVPPQVQDGEHTMFAAMVTDNLSGVRSVSGVIASPSGAVQGFSCQREGESDRYVARINVPADAAAGDWTVKYLTLSDNASNSVNLNAGQGSLPRTATFRVTSRDSDSTGPSLKGARVDKPIMRGGERNTIFVRAEDDKSGVGLVSGVFVSPGKQARIGFGCRENTTGEWECPLTPPACGDCGTWTLEQIQLQDKANNMTTFRGDNFVVKSVTVEITGDACDGTPPVLTSLTLEPTLISNVEGGPVKVIAVIGDEGCGVASLSGQAVPPGNVGGQRLYFSLEPQPDGKTFAGRINVPALAAKGVWTISWLQALDKGHNLRAYSATDPVVSRVTFRVE